MQSFLITATKPTFYSHRTENGCNDNIQLVYRVLEFRPQANKDHQQQMHRMEKGDQVKERDRKEFGMSPISRTSRSLGSHDWATPPDGIFCQQPDIYRQKLPTIPDQFSVSIETIEEVS